MYLHKHVNFVVYSYYLWEEVTFYCDMSDDLI